MGRRVEERRPVTEMHGEEIECLNLSNNSFQIEKEPENFNEDDLKAVREYEEKVQFLMSERERYKMLLKAEYAKLAHSVRDNIKKFNGKLSDLLYLRLQIDSAVSQESLKINRMKLFQYTRKEMIKKEQEIL